LDVEDYFTATFVSSPRNTMLAVTLRCPELEMFRVHIAVPVAFEGVGTFEMFRVPVAVPVAF